MATRKQAAQTPPPEPPQPKWLSLLQAVLQVLFRYVLLPSVGIYGIVLQVQREHADTVALAFLGFLVGVPFFLTGDDFIRRKREDRGP